jgi:hypothetical protein
MVRCLLAEPVPQLTALVGVMNGTLGAPFSGPLTNRMLSTYNIGWGLPLLSCKFRRLITLGLSSKLSGIVMGVQVPAGTSKYTLRGDVPAIALLDAEAQAALARATPMHPEGDPGVALASIGAGARSEKPARGFL